MKTIISYYIYTVLLYYLWEDRSLLSWATISKHKWSNHFYQIPPSFPQFFFHQLTSGLKNSHLSLESSLSSLLPQSQVKSSFSVSLCTGWFVFDTFWIYLQLPTVFCAISLLLFDSHNQVFAFLTGISSKKLYRYSYHFPFYPFQEGKSSTSSPILIIPTLFLSVSKSPQPASQNVIMYSFLSLHFPLLFLLEYNSHHDWLTFLHPPWICYLYPQPHELHFCSETVKAK